MASSDLKAAAAAAFPDQEWDDERLAALKELVMECSSSDYGSDEEDDEGDDEAESKPKLDLALIMGKPKRSA